jgi:hypothetical protein
LKCTLRWNRFDVAKNYISHYSLELKEELDDVFELALILNRADFVNYFLELGVSIDELSVKRLYLLYNYKERVGYNYLHNLA